MMSRIAPRVHAHELRLGGGRELEVHAAQRSRLRWLNATLACAITGLSPCSSNSCWQNARAKKPRSSSLRSRSMTNAPASLVSVKIMRQG